MGTRIILIRHAQTDYTFKKRYSGSIDIGINPTGKAEANKLYIKLKEERVHKIYSSDRIRAIQTAKIVFKKAEIEKIPDLREMHFGIFEGLTYEEILGRYPDIYRRWINNPFRTAIPLGEDLRDFKKRVIKIFQNIISLNKNKTIAIVSHGGTISVFINSILKIKDFWKYIPKSASISIIEYKNGKPEIKLFNDISHLNG